MWSCAGSTWNDYGCGNHSHTSCVIDDCNGKGAHKQTWLALSEVPPTCTMQLTRSHQAQTLPELFVTVSIVIIATIKYDYYQYFCIVLFSF